MSYIDLDIKKLSITYIASIFIKIVKYLNRMTLANNKLKEIYLNFQDLYNLSLQLNNAYIAILMYKYIQKT